MGWKSGSYRDDRVGNFKLRGKKSRLLPCGCCDAFNFKDLFSEHLADEEIKQAKLDFVINNLDLPRKETVS